MTDYSKISTALGVKHWQDSITHDNGQFSQDGGGKSSLLLGQPGKGKSTLMCYEAQMSRCLEISKGDFVRDLLDNVDLSKYRGKIFQETVVWRARDMDSFANIIPQNWFNSFKGTMGSVKDLYVWVHESDTNIVFFSYNHKRQEVIINGMPEPETYRNSEDLMNRLHWGAINVVLEPQTYRLSPTLIQRLREKKMDSSEREEIKEERKGAVKHRGDHTKDRKIGKDVKYRNREVSPAYFWFDLLHIAHKMNKYRHIMFCLDEIDDIFEARSEGDVWKLIELLATDWKNLRKSNISTILSTHEIDFIDWRILPRIDYIVWMTGARLYSKSALKVQNLVSNLPIGLFLIEQRTISFGKNTFGKIPLAQPAVRIDGLKGECFNLSDSVASKLMRQYEDKWVGERVSEIIDLGPEEVKENANEEVPA